MSLVVRSWSSVLFGVLFAGGLPVFAQSSATSSSGHHDQAVEQLFKALQNESRQQNSNYCAPGQARSGIVLPGQLEAPAASKKILTELAALRSPSLAELFFKQWERFSSTPEGVAMPDDPQQRAYSELEKKYGDNALQAVMILLDHYEGWKADQISRTRDFSTIKAVRGSIDPSLMQALGISPAESIGSLRSILIEKILPDENRRQQMVDLVIQNHFAWQGLVLSLQIPSAYLEGGNADFDPLAPIRTQFSDTAVIGQDRPRLDQIQAALRLLDETKHSDENIFSIPKEYQMAYRQLTSARPGLAIEIDQGLTRRWAQKNGVKLSDGDPRSQIPKDKLAKLDAEKWQGVTYQDLIQIAAMKLPLDSEFNPSKEFKTIFGTSAEGYMGSRYAQRLSTFSEPQWDLIEAEFIAQDRYDSGRQLPGADPIDQRRLNAMTDLLRRHLVANEFKDVPSEPICGVGAAESCIAGSRQIEESRRSRESRDRTQRLNKAEPVVDSYFMFNLRSREDILAHLVILRTLPGLKISDLRSLGPDVRLLAKEIIDLQGFYSQYVSEISPECREFKANFYLGSLTGFPWGDCWPLRFDSLKDLKEYEVSLRSKVAELHRNLPGFRVRDLTGPDLPVDLQSLERNPLTIDQFQRPTRAAMIGEEAAPFGDAATAMKSLDQVMAKVESRRTKLSDSLFSSYKQELESVIKENESVRAFAEARLSVNPFKNWDLQSLESLQFMIQRYGWTGPGIYVAGLDFLGGDTAAPMSASQLMDVAYKDFDRDSKSSIIIPIDLRLRLLKSVAHLGSVESTVFNLYPQNWKDVFGEVKGADGKLRPNPGSAMLAVDRLDEVQRKFLEFQDYASQFGSADAYGIFNPPPVVWAQEKGVEFLKFLVRAKFFPSLDPARSETLAILSSARDMKNILDQVSDVDRAHYEKMLRQAAENNWRALEEASFKPEEIQKRRSKGLGVNQSVLDFALRKISRDRSSQAAESFKALDLRQSPERGRNPEIRSTSSSPGLISRFHPGEEAVIANRPARLRLQASERIEMELLPPEAVLMTMFTDSEDAKEIEKRLTQTPEKSKYSKISGSTIQLMKFLGMSGSEEQQKAMVEKYSDFLPELNDISEAYFSSFQDLDKSIKKGGFSRTELRRIMASALSKHGMEMKFLNPGDNFDWKSFSYTTDENVRSILKAAGLVTASESQGGEFKIIREQVNLLRKFLMAQQAVFSPEGVRHTFAAILAPEYVKAFYDELGRSEGSSDSRMLRFRVSDRLQGVYRIVERLQTRSGERFSWNPQSLIESIIKADSENSGTAERAFAALKKVIDVHIGSPTGPVYRASPDGDTVVIDPFDTDRYRAMIKELDDLSSQIKNDDWKNIVSLFKSPRRFGIYELPGDERRQIQTELGRPFTSEVGANVLASEAELYRQPTLTADWAAIQRFFGAPESSRKWFQEARDLENVGVFNSEEFFQLMRDKISVITSPSQVGNITEEFLSALKKDVLEKVPVQLRQNKDFEADISNLFSSKTVVYSQSKWASREDWAKNFTSTFLDRDYLQQAMSGIEWDSQIESVRDNLNLRVLNRWFKGRSGLTDPLLYSETKESPKINRLADFLFSPDKQGWSDVKAIDLKAQSLVSEVFTVLGSTILENIPDGDVVKSVSQMMASDIQKIAENSDSKTYDEAKKLFVEAIEGQAFNLKLLEKLQADPQMGGDVEKISAELKRQRQPSPLLDHDWSSMGAEEFQSTLKTVKNIDSRIATSPKAQEILSSLRSLYIRSQQLLEMNRSIAEKISSETRAQAGWEPFIESATSLAEVVQKYQLPLSKIVDESEKERAERIRVWSEMGRAQLAHIDQMQNPMSHMFWGGVTGAGHLLGMAAVGVIEPFYRYGESGVITFMGLFHGDEAVSEWLPVLGGHGKNLSWWDPRNMTLYSEANLESDSRLYSEAIGTGVGLYLYALRPAWVGTRTLQGFRAAGASAAEAAAMAQARKGIVQRGIEGAAKWVGERGVVKGAGTRISESFVGRSAQRAWNMNLSFYGRSRAPQLTLPSVKSVMTTPIHITPPPMNSVAITAQQAVVQAARPALSTRLATAFTAQSLKATARKTGVVGGRLVLDSALLAAPAVGLTRLVTPDHLTQGQAGVLETAAAEFGRTFVLILLLGQGHRLTSALAHRFPQTYVAPAVNRMWGPAVQGYIWNEAIQVTSRAAIRASETPTYLNLEKDENGKPIGMSPEQEREWMADEQLPSEIMGQMLLILQLGTQGYWGRVADIPWIRGTRGADVIKEMYPDYARIPPVMMEDAVRTIAAVSAMRGDAEMARLQRDLFRRNPETGKSKIIEMYENLAGMNRLGKLGLDPVRDAREIDFVERTIGESIQTARQKVFQTRLEIDRALDSVGGTNLDYTKLKLLIENLEWNRSQQTQVVESTPEVSISSSSLIQAIQLSRKVEPPATRKPKVDWKNDPAALWNMMDDLGLSHLMSSREFQTVMDQMIREARMLDEAQTGDQATRSLLSQDLETFALFLAQKAKYSIPETAAEPEAASPRLNAPWQGLSPENWRDLYRRVEDIQERRLVSAEYTNDSAFIDEGGNAVQIIRGGNDQVIAAETFRSSSDREMGVVDLFGMGLQFTYDTTHWTSRVLRDGRILFDAFDGRRLILSMENSELVAESSPAGNRGQRSRLGSTQEIRNFIRQGLKQEEVDTLSWDALNPSREQSIQVSANAKAKDSPEAPEIRETRSDSFMVGENGRPIPNERIQRVYGAEKDPVKLTEIITEDKTTFIFESQKPNGEWETTTVALKAGVENGIVTVDPINKHVLILSPSGIVFRFRAKEQDVVGQAGAELVFESQIKDWADISKDLFKQPLAMDQGAVARAVTNRMILEDPRFKPAAWDLSYRVMSPSRLPEVVRAQVLTTPWEAYLQTSKGKDMFEGDYLTRNRRIERATKELSKTKMSAAERERFDEATSALRNVILPSKDSLDPTIRETLQNAYWGYANEGDLQFLLWTRGPERREMLIRQHQVLARKYHPELSNAPHAKEIWDGIEKEFQTLSSYFGFGL